MEVINTSKYDLVTITSLARDGREHLVVIAKATYSLDPTRDPILALTPAAAGRCSIAHADTHAGEPGLSAPIQESDLAGYKPRCDVILDARAYAPGRHPVTEVLVSARVGQMHKMFKVFGDRNWQRVGGRLQASPPAAFTELPIHYGRAYGGRVPGRTVDGELHYDTFPSNPVGVGYAGEFATHDLEGMSVPNTESLDQAPHGKSEHPHPLAFGPLARSWSPRRNLAGTYDAEWRARKFPLLPDDFDDAFNQSAPIDQQIPYPIGGEPVEFVNLMPGHELCRFELPEPSLEIRVMNHEHDVLRPRAVVDTIFISPHHGVLAMVYRARLPLSRRGIKDIELVAVGDICEQWWSAQLFGGQDCGCGGNSDNDTNPSAGGTSA